MKKSHYKGPNIIIQTHIVAQTSAMKLLMNLLFILIPGNICNRICQQIIYVLFEFFLDLFLTLFTFPNFPFKIIYRFLSHKAIRIRSYRFLLKTPFSAFVFFSNYHKTYNHIFSSLAYLFNLQMFFFQCLTKKVVILQ